MLLPDFLAVAVAHPPWVAYALVDGQPMRLLGGSGSTLEGRLPRKMQGRCQLEICLEPDDATLAELPKGPVILQSEVMPETSLKPGWKCRIDVLDDHDVLLHRRATRIRVHRMRLVGRIQGESTWVFPVVVRDIGPEGLGIETREPLQRGTVVQLTGFEEFTDIAVGEWSFEVRATFGRSGAGLLLHPGQEAAQHFLRELHAQLEIAGRFWRSLVGHARHYARKENDSELRVSVDFAVKQLRSRKAAQLALIDNDELDKLHQVLKDEDDLHRLQAELDQLAARKKALMQDRKKRVRCMERFLNQVQLNT